MKHFYKYSMSSDYAEYCSNEAKELYALCIPRNIFQLNNCNAKVYEYTMEEGICYVLKSYNTVVAMVSEEGKGLDFLRYVYGYTSTSAKHIKKFFDIYCPDNADIYTYRP